MATSLLRIGRLRYVKCLPAESWSTLCGAPRATAYSTKYGGTKKPSSKKNSDKKQVKTYFDIEKLVQHKNYDFPKKGVPVPAINLAAHPSVPTVKPETVVAVPAVEATNRVAEADPAFSVAPPAEIAAKSTVTVLEDLPKAVLSEAKVAVDPVSEAAPLHTVAAKSVFESVAETTSVTSPAKPVDTVAQMESSTESKSTAASVKAGMNVVAEAPLADVAAEPVVAAVPVKDEAQPVAAVPVAEAAPMENAPEPVIEVVSVEATAPTVAAEPVVEETPVKDVAEPVAEVVAKPLAEDGPMEAFADPKEAAAEAVSEPDAVPAVEDIPMKDESESVLEITAEPVATAAPLEAAAEPVVETVTVEAATEPVVETVTVEAAAEPVVETVTVEAAAEPVADAAPVEEAVPLVVELVTAEAAADVSAPEHDAHEVLDRAPVIDEDAGEKLLEEPSGEPHAAQMDPIQRLFLDSIRQYSTQNQISGEPVDAGPEYQKALAEEISKLQRLYGGGDLTSFPEFKFPEPTFDEVVRK
ncbi:cytadherence high molecular weight protein 1 [Nerophis ophidion]|uniref:cytadherence high molecular weight protein 1 n=1 Tax=Nerophis ophidion TaxID=159077 RepID=UPI002ADFF18C|nr:cytadherence high molecular weight protein 1 [Nerophis ophidion]XP_061774580.1 cytadherence high molecular weight protein 1 [Nerophis ophidion]